MLFVLSSTLYYSVNNMYTSRRFTIFQKVTPFNKNKTLKVFLAIFTLFLEL